MICDAGFELIDHRGGPGRKKTIEASYTERHSKRRLLSGHISGYYIRKNRKRLVAGWESFNYFRRCERLKTYKHIEEQKLDYNFYVALKDGQ